MAASKSPPPTAEPPADTPATEAPDDVPGASSSGDTYAYAWPTATVYPHIPLTAHPADDRGPATVFGFPDGPPDGRWEPTGAEPNQVPDNHPDAVPEPRPAPGDDQSKAGA